jgi:hypothetical protein
MGASIKSSHSVGSQILKFKRFLRRLLFATIVFSPSPCAQAQDSGVTLTVDFVAWGNEISGLSLKSGGAGQTFSALPFRYSTPVSYSGPAVMEVYQGNSNATPAPSSAPTQADKDHQMAPLLQAIDAEEQKTSEQQPKTGLVAELENRRKKDPSLVALIPLPGGSKRVTILLAPLGKNTFRGYVINDDPSQLPLGKVRVHNLSPFPIALRTSGKKPVELKVGTSIIADCNKNQFVYEVAYKLNDKWKLQENNLFPVRSNEQAQMIVIKSDNQYFQSSDGTGSGFLQIVTLIRSQTP